MEITGLALSATSAMSVERPSTTRLEPYLGVERYYPGFEGVFYAVGWLDCTSTDGKYGVSIILRIKDKVSWGARFNPEKIA